MTLPRLTRITIGSGPVLLIGLLVFLLGLGGCGDDATKNSAGRTAADAPERETTGNLTLDLLASAAGIPLGADSAPVVVYELSDFQCPACRMVAERFLPNLKMHYVDGGRVRLVFVDFPLTNRHPNAFPAALAARCAREQMMFWLYHDRLFDKQTEWSRVEDPTNLFVQYAGELGLDAGSFETCLKEGRYRDEVQRNLDIALQLKARGTPTFYVNGKEIFGSGRAIVAAIEGELRVRRAR